MPRLFLSLFIIVLILTACAPTAPGTAVATSASILGLTELKYRVLAEFPDFFFCDPDYYPLGRGDELGLALQRFPELQANLEEFNAILAHNNLAGLSTFSDDQKLLIYREHKKLAALQFELTANSYSFQLQDAKTEGKSELVTGTIDGQGRITIQHRTPSYATCPICLAAGTLIDTPTGPVPVQNIRVGTVVWTMDRAGARLAEPVIQVGSTVVPPTHQMVHLVLDDGREVWVSPGHPTTDGRSAGQLKAGDSLDGGMILSAERVGYSGYATYDLLHAGDTGFYWANGILLGSTLTNEPGTRMYVAWQQQDDPTRFIHLFIFEDAIAQMIHSDSHAVKRFESVYSPELVGGNVVFTDFDLVATNQK